MLFHTLSSCLNLGSRRVDLPLERAYVGDLMDLHVKVALMYLILASGNRSVRSGYSRHNTLSNATGTSILDAQLCRSSRAARSRWKSQVVHCAGSNIPRRPPLSTLSSSCCSGSLVRPARYWRCPCCGSLCKLASFRPRDAMPARTSLCCAQSRATHLPSSS